MSSLIYEKRTIKCKKCGREFERNNIIFQTEEGNFCSPDCISDYEYNNDIKIEEIIKKIISSFDLVNEY